ncbi:dual specificity protein phosphatase [Ephemerocybe angulata]|uniref:Dual specificity protein phosphatase n=1 Tax=Ephemerocybe angulata TaxID=980116 RepID=A0A8H6I6Q9_9AGAR|nr:dual specificity protein phosphatase [Tulosesus angulatus]
MSSQRRGSSSSSSSSTDLQWLQRKYKSLAPLDRSNPWRAGCPRPLPNSYWATPRLVACEYPCSTDLLRVGRTANLLPYESILCKRATLLGIDPTAIEYHRFPIRDRCLPKTTDLLDLVFETVSAIHCRGGIGRTGLVVGCWLTECGAAKDGEEALRIISNEWRSVEKFKRYPHSPETGPQFDFVAKFCPRELQSL